MADRINQDLADVMVRDAGRTWMVEMAGRADEMLRQLLPGVDGPVRFALPTRRPRHVIGALPRLRCTRCRQLCWWTPADDTVKPDSPVLCSDCMPPELLELLRQLVPPQVVCQALSGGLR